jgi:hypothetical protein
MSAKIVTFRQPMIPRPKTEINDWLNDWIYTAQRVNDWI